MSEMAAYDILRWYIEAGVDEAIGEEPVDRYARSAEVAQAVETQRPQPPVGERRAGPQSPLPMAEPSNTPAVELRSRAAHLAMEAKTLDQLRAAMETFDGCALKAGAQRTVFADGNPEASLMIIGEAPGADEDTQGLPFVGVSGQLLNRMLASIGLDRTQVYITNVIPWRPGGNRKPTPSETELCLPFIERHIELADPDMLLLLGGAAASALLAKQEGIGRLRGRWFEFACRGLSRPLPALATFHPAYLLRTPDAKRLAWRDLLMVRRWLDQHGKTPAR